MRFPRSRFIPAVIGLLLSGPMAAPHLRAQDGSVEERAIASYPPAYVTAIQSSMQAFAARDFKRARQMVDRADVLFKSTALALNIRGAICIEEKNYDEGRAYCEKALKEEPNFFPAQFNLCEIPFAQKKYAEARDEFEQLLADYPQNDLVKFRVFLTYLLAKDEAGTAKYLERIPFLSDTPVFYYTRAAIDFEKGNIAEAREWMDRGYYVFPPARHQNFIDVFYDLGWVERPGFSSEVAAPATDAPAAPAPEAAAKPPE